MKGFVVIMLALLSGCAVNGEWSHEDTRRELVWDAAAAMDTWQTMRIRHLPHIEEGGSLAVNFIGKQPEPKDVALYMASYSVAHFLVSRALPPRWRKYWQYGTAVEEWHVVIKNCQLHRNCIVSD